jgi:hypothetical protein
MACLNPMLRCLRTSAQRNLAFGAALQKQHPEAGIPQVQQPVLPVAGFARIRQLRNGASNQLQNWRRKSESRTHAVLQNKMLLSLRRLEFANPDNPQVTLFCPWHGKVKKGQFRIHFEWPRPKNQKHMKAYKGRLHWS